MTADATTSSDTRTVFRTCPLCEATCGLAITLEGDTVTHVRGDADDVFSRGFICPKGAAMKELHADPDRLRRPLVKRDGRHVEVSWAEAYAAVEAGLKPILGGGDPNAVAIYLGNPVIHTLAGPIYGRALIKALKTRNVFSASTVDQMAKHVSAGLMFGHPLSIPVPDIDRTDCLLIFGANPWVSNGSLWTAPDLPGRLKALQARGGRFVVVDPRRTETAERADEHVPIRPGTDAHMLCAMIRVLFEEGRADLGRLAAFTDGSDAVRAAVEPFALDVVAETTGVPAETIRRLALELADADSGATYGRVGVQAARFGTLCAWAADVLNALTGNLDAPGGAMFAQAAHTPAPTGPGGRGYKTGRWRSRVRDLPEVNGELPCATLPDEILTPGEGQVRALVTVAGNPALSNPHGRRVDQALGSLEFMVSVDCYLNETTRFADVVLPPPPPLARGHYDLAFMGFAVRRVANWSPPVIEPEGPDESEILAKLALIAQGMGAEAPADWAHAAVLQRVCRQQGASTDVLGEVDPTRPAVERALDVMLRTGRDGLTLDALEAQPHGVDLGPLEPALPDTLSTPDGRLALGPTPILDDLKRLAGDLGPPPEGELRLIGRRHPRTNNSWMHNIERLARGEGRCALLIHPDDADARGLSNGDRVVVASRVGEVEAEAELTDSVAHGTVCLPHGWGHGRDGARLSVAARHPGVNTNDLTDHLDLDPLCGTAALNAIPVTVARAEPATEEDPA